MQHPLSAVAMHLPIFFCGKKLIRAVLISEGLGDVARNAGRRREWLPENDCVSETPDCVQPRDQPWLRYVQHQQVQQQLQYLT